MPPRHRKLPRVRGTTIIIYWSGLLQESVNGGRMQVAVELFGIPRSRAGLAKTTATGANLGDVLVDLARNFPQLAETCIEGRFLRPGFIVNLNAERFVTSPESPLNEGDTLLLLSLDAGG